MENIQMISLKGKTVMFRLTDYECYFLGNRICSLVETKEGNARKPFGGVESEVTYCRNLCNSILIKGVLNPIRITEHKKCGHYSFTDGQHRACITSKIDINVPAIISIHEGECYCCYWKKHSVEYFLISFVYELYWLKKKYRWLLQRLLKKPASFLAKL